MRNNENDPGARQSADEVPSGAGTDGSPGDEEQDTTSGGSPDEPPHT
jgi:hypothetical protein